MSADVTNTDLERMMSMRMVLVAAVAAAAMAIAGGVPARAQSPEATGRDTPSYPNGDSASRWSIGTSLTYPLVRIYQLRIGYALDHRHQLVFGPCFQNFRHESFTSRAYTLLLGYRYWVGDGLNLEAELYPAYNSLRSHVTGSSYPGLELWGEIKVGYRFDLGRSVVHPAGPRRWLRDTPDQPTPEFRRGDQVADLRPAVDPGLHALRSTLPIPHPLPLLDTQRVRRFTLQNDDYQAR